jgi:predicted O-methyltransferase YrrM
MSARTISMTDALHEYLVAQSVHLTDPMRRLREETATMPQGGMQISAEQGQFMQLLIRLIGAKKGLEVGVFTGYSALCVAKALPEDGILHACDISDEFTRIGRRYWREENVEDKIELHLGPATETLERFLKEGQAGTFDFAFIDADKPNYDAYYEAALQLLRPGGLIGIDNTLWSGKVADQSVQDESTVALRALNAKIHADTRVDACILPLGDGLTLARKR